jgi:hypothetical protein
MSNGTRRTLSVLCLSLVLCMPLQAQTAPRTVDTLSGFLSALWDRLSAPLVSMWAADETDGRSTIDPLGGNTAGETCPDGCSTTDGRSTIDPLG